MRDASCAQLKCVLPLLQSARHRLPWFIQGPLCPQHSDSTAISRVLSTPNRGYYDQRLKAQKTCRKTRNGPSIPHGRADTPLRQLYRLRRCWPVGHGGIISINLHAAPHHPVVDQVHDQPSI